MAQLAVDNKEVVRRLIGDLVNDERYDVAPEIIAEGYVRHENGAMEKPSGPEDFVAALKGFRTAFPDFEMSIDGLIAEDDLVSFYATQRGTHEGPFMGIEPTGKEFETGGNVTHRIEDGKIAETWATFDYLSMLRQLGAVPDRFDA